jgi:hypothetical protein
MLAALVDGGAVAGQESGRGVPKASRQRRNRGARFALLEGFG